MDARLQESGKQFVKFGFVGASGIVVNLAVLKATLFVWGWRSATRPTASSIFGSRLAFCVAVVNNYLLNRWWTFRSTGSFARELPKFFIVSVDRVLGSTSSAFLCASAASSHRRPVSQSLAIPA